MAKNNTIKKVKNGYMQISDKEVFEAIKDVASMKSDFKNLEKVVGEKLADLKDLINERFREVATGNNNLKGKVATNTQIIGEHTVRIHDLEMFRKEHETNIELNTELRKNTTFLIKHWRWVLGMLTTGTVGTIITLISLISEHFNG